MKISKITGAARVGTGLVAVSLLAGCLGSGGGGGGGGGGGSPATMAEYDARLAEVRGMIPTSDMQTTGTAKFSGATKLDIVRGGTGHVIGDVAIDVNFAAASDAAITGTAGNWRGVVDGKDVTYDGTLSTGPKYPTGFLNDDIPVPVLPGGPIPGAPTSVRPGSASIAMYGNIDSGAAAGSEVLLTLGGNFVGAGGQALHGTAMIQQITGTSIAESAGTGTFYVERD